MKLHLSTGGERCVNPFENLNSFMPLALPSWTYPRLKFSSMLQLRKEKFGGRRIRGGRRFGGSCSTILPYESMARERGFARSRFSSSSSLAASARFPLCPGGSFNSRTVPHRDYLFPRTAYAGVHPCYPRAHASTITALISARAETFMLTDARVLGYPISGLSLSAFPVRKNHATRENTNLASFVYLIHF